MKQIYVTSANPNAKHTGRIHIDRIRVKGPCTHVPIGTVMFLDDESVGLVAVGSRPAQKVLREGSEEAYIRSKAIRDDGMAYELEIHCCPPAVLQRHNFFGHGSMLSYLSSIFDRATRACGIEVSPDDRESWKNGDVLITEVHLTGNFGCSPQDIIPIIQAIDDNNSKGKHRDEETCITLGYTPKRRSKYHAVTVYAKGVLLSRQWKNRGRYQRKILDLAANSIRAEVKLYSMLLSELGLRYAARWRDLDVHGLFFQIFNKYKITHSIQPLLTGDELKLLTPSEAKAYKLWLHGVDIKDQFKSRSSARKYINGILAKTGMDISGNRRPEALPVIDLAEVFAPENLLPIPEWAPCTEHYFPPNQPDMPALPRRSKSGTGRRGIGSAPICPDAED